MIQAEDFIEEGRRRGFLLYSGVPCSYLKPFINYVIDSPNLNYVAAANEGDAVAIAAGATLSGINSVVMFQNSGLGNAVNPITSLNQIFKIPSLIITTLRGEPDGPKDEPQHELMGRITTDLLDLMEVNWQYFPDTKDEILKTFDKALKVMSRGDSYALVMKKGSVASHDLASLPKIREIKSQSNNKFVRNKVGSRSQALKQILANTSSKDLLIATTGYTGRELFAIEDNANQLYSVGSMGCASSMGLGLALTAQKNRVITLDGDGAVLMRMGALATIGYYRPRNFLHILLNNEVHESTGGQSTVSHSIDFTGIASSCGYQAVLVPESLEELGDIVADQSEELTFCLVNIDKGVMDNLPRPDVTPREVVLRFKNYISRYYEQR